MSYFIETEEDEVLERLEETYFVDCPYCKSETIEQMSICAMPWGIDDELEIECPKCKEKFEIRPKYKFQGFFVYSNSEVKEKYENDR